MFEVRQQFNSTAIDDIEAAVRHEFSRLTSGEEVQSGKRVALAVGSRGIHGLSTIVSAAVDSLRQGGLTPFVIPAMGSHGRATAAGQIELLAELGISESSVDAPVVATMEVVSLGKLESGADVFFAREALEADHVVVINRVKPHTAFRGHVESGLCKMLAVGCGRREGAANMHRFDLAESIVPAAQLILEKAPVLCGLAIVENSKGLPHTVRLALPDEFVRVDRELLRIGRTLFPTIPTDDLDILLIDEMGKNISGSGIDPNVTGFWRRDGGPREPDYRTLIVLDLTDESRGNATGIGMADLTTQRVINKIDREATYINCLTSGVIQNARLPMALENDRVVLETALKNVAHPQKVRMVRIENTLKLETFWASQALLPELDQWEGIEVNEKPLKLEFDKEGRLLSFA